ncbi:MAG: hypothetical protein OEY67_01830 [Gammaproteobacteria bacterium]|nr:hypothetical protein [Gammaproteobacteria bacterium]
MKQLFYIVSTLLLAALAAHYAMQDVGYVLITRGTWSMETSLMVFAFLLFAGAVIFYGIWYLVSRIWKLRSNIKKWQAHKQTEGARQSFRQGILHMIENNWQEAETCFLEDVDHSDLPAINFLGAALACQQRQDYEKRDAYIARAKNLSPEHVLTILFSRARLQHIANQHEREIETLKEIYELDPKHSPTLKQLLYAYTELGDWSSVIDLAPEARKTRGIDKREVSDLELKAASELLKLSLPSGSAEILKKAWQKIPKSLRDRPELIASYAGQLIKQNQTDEAGKLLRQAIDFGWNEQLVALYGQTLSAQPEKQFSDCQKWLADHKDSPALLLTLARLARHNGFLDKALTYVNQSIEQQRSADAFLLKGDLLEQQGKTGDALRSYRQAISALL